MRLKALFSAQDMTKGPPYARILEFAFPMLLGNIAQQLYNTADSIIVGHYLGDNALSAVGSAGPVINLLLALLVGIGSGAGIVVSQSYGAKNREALTANVGNSIALGGLASLVLTVAGTLAAMPMLRFLGTPESIIDWSASYLQIFFLGILGFCMYNMLSGIMRGLGDSLSALGFLLIAAVLNIFLDLLFVAKYHMGVSGVALATVLAQSISAVLCYWRLLHMRDVFDLNFSTIRVHKDISKKIIRMGIPTGISQMLIATSTMAAQNLINSMGEMVIACNVIIMRVDGFAMMPNFTYGTTMGVFAGQNVGAQKFDRLHHGVRQGMFISVSTAVVVTLIITTWGHVLFGFFTETEELIDLAVRMMRILAIGYIAMSVSQIMSGTMRGAGDTVSPMCVSFITTLVLRIPSAYILAYFSRTPEWPHGQPYTLFLSLMFAWVMGAIITGLLFKFGPWKKKMHVRSY